MSNLRLRDRSYLSKVTKVESSKNRSLSTSSSMPFPPHQHQSPFSISLAMAGLSQIPTPTATLTPATMLHWLQHQDNLSDDERRMNIGFSLIQSLNSPALLSLLRELLGYGLHHQFLQGRLVLRGLGSILFKHLLSTYMQDTMLGTAK